MVLIRFLFLVFFFAFVTIISIGVVICALSLLMTGNVMAWFAGIKRRWFDEQYKGTVRSKEIWDKPLPKRKKK